MFWDFVVLGTKFNVSNIIFYVKYLEYITFRTLVNVQTFYLNIFYVAKSYCLPNELATFLLYSRSSVIILNFLLLIEIKDQNTDNKKVKIEKVSFNLFKYGISSLYNYHLNSASILW